MTLEQYFLKYPALSSRNAHLEKIFLETILYPILGEYGLSLLEYQKKIYSSENHHRYYIDFVLVYNGKKYAFEVDGYHYHGKPSKKRFDSQEDRTNEITLQGFELVRYSYNQITNNPDKVRAQIQKRINFFTPRTAYHNSTRTLTTAPLKTIISSEDYEKVKASRDFSDIQDAKIESRKNHSDNEWMQKKRAVEGSESRSIIVMLIIFLVTIVAALILIWYVASVKNNSQIKHTSSTHDQNHAEADSGQNSSSNHNYSSTPESTNNQNYSSTQNTGSNQEKYISSFVEKYNAVSTLKIKNLISIDITDRTSPYYRGTNSVVTAPVKKMKAKYGTVENSPIWIMSCSSDDSSKMRIYAEVNDYYEAASIVRAGIKAISSSVSSSEMKPLEDSISMQKGYVGVISGVYVMFGWNYENKFYAVHYSHQCSDGAY